jgi:serine/threonine-protein kinase
MTKQTVDGISFKLKKPHDFSFLREHGKVFCVFDQNDSGNISFGTDNGNEKYFIKIAGAETAASCTTPEEAVARLKTAVQNYVDLAHPNLISLTEYFICENLFITVFKWSDGDCLFDHWNFERYDKDKTLYPGDRFKNLPCDKKLNAFDRIFDFLVFTEASGYVSVDFYDGSILYDFKRDYLTICDIDLFRKSPAVNDMGVDFWGTKRLKSPEEYIQGAPIDNITNVFTMGALLFHFFGSYTSDEISGMYESNTFTPCRFETWELDKNLYKVALKAVSPDREARYGSMAEFYDEWKKSMEFFYKAPRNLLT